MTEKDFASLFDKATGFSPFPWQERLARSSPLPETVSVPTGMGKTAGAAVGWLWRRRFAPEPIRAATPRRLVYCLPMRVLAEQTLGAMRGWLKRLGLLAEGRDDAGVSVSLLMGGEVDARWDLAPEREAMIVGTQDMLLSRGLNRGYSMSRYRWPVHFGLLSNDALWVMDEVQLMGAGLDTSAQLQAFRRDMSTFGPTHTLWMSATVRPEWLHTVDHAPGGELLGPSEADWASPAVRPRADAAKRLEEAGFTPDGKGSAEAELLLEGHTPGTRTLCVVNTVRRAVRIYRSLMKLKPDADVVLLHSRFRPPDRAAAVHRALQEPGPAGTVCVSTQVVEAGVDITSRLLLTDTAPWPSMVQRFGRCNRYGEAEAARAVWIPPDLSKPRSLAPYEPDEIGASVERLRGLSSVSPRSLPPVERKPKTGDIPRRRDILELFDTTPDLAGADLDISRFIRDSTDTDLQVFWREIADRPAEDAERPSAAELCSVPVGDLSRFLEKKQGWVWDHLEGVWARANPYRLRPGMTVLLASSAGGYDTALGWTGKGRRAVEPLSPSGETSESNDSDRYAEAPPQSIAEHTDQVVGEMRSMLSRLACIDAEHRRALLDAARWHDAGKAHHIFQEALGCGAGDSTAKGPSLSRYARKGFRHELASGLAALAGDRSDLEAYLAAAHHGKVRLSIRSLPTEQPPDDPQKRFARGIHDGDVLPQTDLGGGVTMPRTVLDLSLMELGRGPQGPSWLSRTITLRDDLGPFRLAFLEALMKVADERASAAAKEVDHE